MALDPMPTQFLGDVAMGLALVASRQHLLPVRRRRVLRTVSRPGSAIMQPVATFFPKATPPFVNGAGADLHRSGQFGWTQSFFKHALDDEGSTVDG